MVHLVVSGIKDFEEVVQKIEFPTLMFFASLFILMRALEQLGLIDLIGETTSHLIELVPAGNARLGIAVSLILWVSAFASAFIDNIPYTAAMVPVVAKLASGGIPFSNL
jgi:Na+/H+ antiporter NhaD/arsenite permease-like protein